MTPLARDALVVFSQGEEVPGASFYGLRERCGLPNGQFPASVWSGFSRFRESVLHGEAWEVIRWDVALARWPSGEEWMTAVSATLRAHLEAGCRVAWIGAEGFPLCDGPWIFDPCCMSGGVLAWMTQDAFECPLDPDRLLVPVDDDQLLRLRRYAAGLADVR